jgi:hypothetical protein
MKLKEWAEKAGVKYLTAYRWFKAGTLPVKAYQTDSGTIIVEDNSQEQNMSNTSNDAMSLFLKKTVEFSKNNATVEDFAAYIISNFQIKMNNSSEGPRYSRQKPKPEDVQKHFQQFIPKGEKPKPNSFIMEPEAFQELLTNTPTSALVSTPDAGAEAMGSPEGTITRSVDLNTTPQPINYTGSNNLTFGSPLSSVSTLTTGVMGLTPDSAFSPVAVSNNAMYGGIVSQDFSNPNSSYFVNNLDSETSGEIKLNQPRSKRGRKPNKK